MPSRRVVPSYVLAPFLLFGSLVETPPCCGGFTAAPSVRESSHRFGRSHPPSRVVVYVTYALPRWRHQSLSTRSLSTDSAARCASRLNRLLGVSSAALAAST
eukprot:8076910-Pyramimonas_sp.AAC.5